MTDIALSFAPGAATADLSILAGDLATDDGLVTAVIISLFSDARAADDDKLVDDGADRRGWWGDCLNPEANDRLGSTLWVLERSTLTEATRLDFIERAKAALAWLIADGLASAITVEAEIVQPGVAHVSGGLAWTVTIAAPTGSAAQRVAGVWSATARSLETL